MIKPSYFLAGFTVLFGGFLVVLRSGSDGDEGGSGRREVVRLKNSLPDNRVIPVVRVTGRILDRLGWPVGSTQVAARTAADQEVVGVAEADASGAFSIELADNTPVDITVSAPGHGAEVVRVFPARRGFVCLTLGPALPWPVGTGLEPWRSGQLAGEAYVKDEEGVLLEDAEIVVRETGMAARSDENGRFRIGLPSGPCSLLVRHGDRSVATLDLPEPTRLQGLVPLPDVIVQPGLSLEGMVTTPGGESADGVPVRVVGQGLDTWTMTETGGGFRVAGVLPGDYLVSVCAHRGALGLSSLVSLAPDTSLLQLRLRAERPLDLQVVREGQGLPRVHVYCREEGGLRTAHAQADERGFVQLRGLAHVAPEFEVRTDGQWSMLPVADYDAKAGELRVAADDDE